MARKSLLFYFYFYFLFLLLLWHLFHRDFFGKGAMLPNFLVWACQYSSGFPVGMYEPNTSSAFVSLIPSTSRNRNGSEQ